MSAEVRYHLADPNTFEGPVFNARIAAGWELEGDINGTFWWSPTYVQEAQWDEEGWPFPEDEGYAAFIASRPDLAG